jgi:Na+/H+ antiporter NhaB
MTGESGNPLPETAENRSSRFAAFRRLEPVWTAVLILGVVGAILMVVSEFTTLRSVSVVTASCDDLAQAADRGACITKGHEEHAYALVLMGIVAVLMAWGAAIGRSRPAALALVGIGVAVLVIAFATDVPDIHKTGVIGERFDSAKAGPGPGLWLEIAGGALVLAAGVVAVAARPRTLKRRSRRR